MIGTTYPDMVFGRIEHFVRAGGTEDAPLLLARVYLFSGVREADVARELEAQGLAFWRHDYGILTPGRAPSVGQASRPAHRVGGAAHAIWWRRAACHRRNFRY